MSATDQYKDTERIPEPAVAQAAHRQHEDANGPGRPPAVKAAHQTHIALLDIAQYRSGYGHAQTSAGRLASDSIDSEGCLCERLIRALQRRANKASSRKVAKVATGTRTARGLSSRVQGRS